MANPSTSDRPRVIDILKQRQAAIAEDARRVVALFEEEQVLKKTAAFYAENDGDRSEHAAEFLEELHARINAISEVVDLLLPSYDENRLINSLIYSYDREAAAIDPEMRASIRRNQRSLLSRHVDAQKRLEEDRRRQRETEAAASRYSRDFVLRDVGANRNQMLHTGNVQTVTELPNSKGTTASASPEHVKPSNVLSIGATAFITAAQNEDATKNRPADELGATIVEFMTRIGVSEIAFTDLYNELRPLLIEHSAAPNEKARIESFRYHLRTAGKRFGFHYDRGRVVRDVPLTSATEGGDATQKNG
jgi:hypothetical protein